MEISALNLARVREQEKLANKNGGKVSGSQVGQQRTGETDKGNGAGPATKVEITAQDKKVIQRLRELKDSKEKPTSHEIREKMRLKNEGKLKYVDAPMPSEIKKASAAAGEEVSNSSVLNPGESAGELKERLKEALQGGIVSFNPKERKVLENILGDQKPSKPKPSKTKPSKPIKARTSQATPSTKPKQ